MRQDLIKAVLEGQAGLDECQEAMSEALRGIMVKALLDQLNAEVTTLCGPYYKPEPGAAHRRADSAEGLFRLNGQEERFARPRVRQKHGREVYLKTYAVVQRCLVHKERNLRGCLSRKDYPELNRLMNRLRRIQGAEAAREALADLKRFVAGKNRKALESVEEAGEELIALHLLEAPSTLQVSLLSTNAVENPIRNFRAKTRRVTRWRPQRDKTPADIETALRFPSHSHGTLGFTVGRLALHGFALINGMLALAEAELNLDFVAAVKIQSQWN